MSLIKTSTVQVGRSGAASNNFHWRNLLDGLLRLSRGNAGSPITDVMRVNADNSVEFPGGIADKNQCTAWVNFNGTGTVSIRDSYNVSSISDNGAGDYTVNFATALTNANYAVGGCIGFAAAGPSNTSTVFNLATATPKTTGWCRFYTKQGTNAVDVDFVDVQVFGGK